MYAVIVMFALALLSPLPFVSPFTSVYADELPFQTQPSSNVPTPDSPVKTSATEGSVELVASLIASDTVVIKAIVNDVPSFAIVANSTEIPFNFSTDVFKLSGSDNNGNTITNVNSESWFAHEHIEYSFIGDGTPNLSPLVSFASTIPVEQRLGDKGLRFGSSIVNLGDIDGDGVSDIAVGSQGDGDEFALSFGTHENVWRFLHRNQGAFHILFMNEDGTIKSSIKYGANSTNMPNLADESPQPFDAELGGSIVSLGDVYNDGTLVLAVGAEHRNAQHTADGAVYILHLDQGGSRILDGHVITALTLGINLSSYSHFGSSIANIGDVDNNGVPDLAIGAFGFPPDSDPRLFAGAAFILHMGENAESVLKVAKTLSSALPELGIETDDSFGNAITLLETYDDGTISIAISSPVSGPTNDNRIGSIYILNMTDQASTISSIDILNYTTPNLVLNERNYDIDGLSGIVTSSYSIGSFGSSLVNMGDLNGNGVNDILVGYPYLNSIGGAYILYMNSDNSVQHTAKFQIDRFESENGTQTILNDDQSQIDKFRKYFNYSDPPNMPTHLFQEHYLSSSDELDTGFFDLGGAVVNFGDVHNDGYADIGLSSVEFENGKILVLNRLGPVVNVTFDPNYAAETIHYIPTATDFITVNGIELHNPLDIMVHDNIRPIILNATFEPSRTFSITFHRDIDASSVSINDFAINGTVYTGSVSVSGAVVTLSIDDIFAPDMVHTVSIVGEVLDMLGNAAMMGDSISIAAKPGMGLEASRIDKNTITLNFTNALSINSDNTNVNAFKITDATVTSWSITDTVITIITSGLTGTDETPIISYDDSYLTNLRNSTGPIPDSTTVTVVDKIPPEYIDTVATGINTLTIQFSEKLGTISLNETNFVIDPNYTLERIEIINENIVLTTEDDIFQFPTVGYSALIVDLVGNNDQLSSSNVLASDGFGPKLIRARTIDINTFDLVFNEQTTQTVFDKNSVTIDDLEIKSVTKINQTAWRVVTEQFSPGYMPDRIRIDIVLTDNLGNDNLFGDAITNTVQVGVATIESTGRIIDGIEPSPILFYHGGWPPGLQSANVDPRYLTIIFDEELDRLQYILILSINKVPIDTATIYNTSGLPHDNSFRSVSFDPSYPNLISGYGSGIYDGTSISFINITGPISDLSNNTAKIGTTLDLYDNELPTLTDARVEDDSTIAMTFDKLINYSTVSTQDFTINATITISDVLTRGDTIYLTTDKLVIGESYLVSLVGSVADYFDNATNPTNIAVLYETVIAEDFTITSNNTNPAYAKSGDALMINLTVSEILTSVDATVLGSNVQPNSTNKTTKINTVVPVNVVDGFVTFAIDVVTENGSMRTFTQNNLAENSNVLIDNTNPSFVSSSYDFDKLVHLTFSENISSASAYEHNNNKEILTTINGPVVTLNTTSIQNTTIINATVYDYAGNSYSHLPVDISSLIGSITISSLNIENNGTSIVRANQNITVTLVTDGTDLGNFTGTLLGRSFTNTTSGGTATFTTTILSNDTNENATFSITATNSSGSRIHVTNDNITDGSFVTIDTVKPIITLTGNSDDNVFRGETYTDESATVSDPNNSAYSETVTALTTVDTSLLGPQNITYSAPADAAGNVPDSINRTVTVLAKPLDADTLTIVSNNAKNTSYAKDGDLITITLDANGTIGSATAEIASNTVTPTLTGGNLVATYTVDSTFGDTNSLEFKINITNQDATASKEFTQADLPNSSIIIDNTAPSIALVGDNNTLVATDTSYTDGGALASDTSFTSDITLTGTSNDFDITTPGNYTFTYTAEDRAGNIATITRAVEVRNAPPISINTFIINSDQSGNSKYAKAGDKLDLILNVNYSIVSYTVQIPNTATPTINPVTNRLFVTATVLDTSVESNATFTITVTNVNGTTLTITENDLTGDNVFVDTISPRIATDDGGPADYFIVNGTVPVIQNVTVTDEDPKYSGNYTLIANATVNTNINGSVYNYTYTADADSAGNPGSSLTRIITIIDADPINVTSLTITSSSGDNFANADKIITVRLETDGTDLGNFTGTLLGRAIVKGDVSSGTTTFEATVSSNDANGNATLSIVATNSTGNRIHITNADITDGSFVIIDTVKPIIALNGNLADTVLQGTSYVDLGATVSDPDNSAYSETATTPTTVDISRLGAQLLSYSAPADAAGNVPDSITRTVTVQAKPLDVETLTIVSNNAKNNSYAKDGDSITITLDANGTIGSATTINIASSTITPTPTSDSFTVLYAVNSSLADTNGLAFTITLYNEDNTTSRTFTQTSLSGSNIIIDNTAPSIALVGNNNTTVPTDSSYTDGGALASDTSFTSDITLTGTSTDFDITTPGNYTFTYTAEDKAGNTATITRAVEVKDTPPIGINTFTINSNNNANSTYAKAGDTLSLFLNVNNSIVSHTIQISNANVTDVTAVNNQLIITATVLDNPVESNIDFTITVTNSNGTTLTVTENDITSTSIFIDTIPPRIATDDDGPADYFIVNGTVPVIQNVTVTDEDPNYSGNYTLIANATVNTNINGSVYNYTYTADADTAGNPGDSLTRIITIIDADPINVTSLTITSSSGDNFANADKIITVRLETDGTDLGNFTGTLLGRAIVKGDVSSGTTTFEATVSSNDANGNATFSIVVTNSTGNRIDITNADITDGSFVIIDTVKPIIALNGNLADTVLQGTSYVDLGATVSDPDNSAYSETATTPTTVDISRLGAQLLSYSAPADAAGNVPDSITRTVTVQAKPLDVETLTIVSNNAKNNSYAKDGDSITITLDANGTIGSATTINIASSTITPTPTSDSFTALYTVDSSLADTNGLAFTITLYNEDNTTSRTFTQTSLSGSNIIIDNTAPSIALVGNTNITVPTDSSYTDGGALASDTSFTSDITLTGTSTDFDITTPGNYTFTYTAEDRAGNTATITRAVQVKDTPPIGINTFTINSNNANSTYAKAGDDLSLFLNVNNSIVSHTIQISNTNANETDVTAVNNQLFVTATVLDNPVESNIDFTITVTNSNGTTLTITENDITSTSIFIDTIPPRIATDDGGPADYFLVNGTDPSIRNVTVTDGDPNYSGNYTLVTPNGIVDTSVNGSVFNYTYTADDDNAGNPGDRLTRIITIIDAPLIGITSLSITSSPGNPNFANADNTITLRLQTDSNNLGNFTGTLLGKAFTNTTSGGTATFTVPVSSNDTNGNVTFSIVATNSSGGRVSFTESDLDTDSFVTIDTVAPTITLNGENDTVVALGEDYTYLGATAYDLSYGNTQVSTTDRVNVNQLGHYTLHYTAPTDAAGNTGPTIIRIVEVLDAPPINITLFTIRNGGDSSSLYAKAGDDLSIQLSINYTIASYTATIFGIEQSESNQNSKGFLISQQVPYDLAIEEYASFSITIVDENGLPNTITQNTNITSTDMPPDNIFIDTISPTVTLSPQEPTISVNQTLPTITATIIDGDPNYNYSGTSPIPESIVNASVDNTTAEVYAFTYTAPADTAGNLGQSVTINIIVKDENGSTVLNSSALDGVQQSFSSSESIKAEIHDNIINDNITLSLESKLVELDVSDITDPISGNSYTMKYPHPLDLIVNNRISAQIDNGTVLDFTTTNSNHTIFTVKYLPDDGHNDDAIQLGLENVRYNLTDDAIAITFERVSSSPTVYIRENTNDSYKNVTLYSGIVTDGASAYTTITTNSNYSNAGALYTHDTTTRTVTLWTTHLSTAKENSTSSGGGDESDSNSPTLGKASSGAQLVTNGFEYNGLTVNVGRYHTEFPLIGTNVGDINTIKMKVYDSAGPSGVKRVEFALGVPDIGLYHEAEAFVEVWMQRDSVAVQETIIVDELNLLENSDVSATVSQTSCSDGAQQCLLVELQYSYREPPAYNTISIKPVDWDNNAHQFYFNDGIHVDGDSINLPKEITISASHAADTTHAGETLHLVQIDRAEHLWVDQYGYQWMIIGNTVRQITVPEYLVPDDNTYGTLHGPDRNHPEFASSVYAEQQRAQETLAEILGHATIIKPLPENGGTIYFDATGTDSRSGDSFKLLLELETARMQQLSNLLYDDIN